MRLIIVGGGEVGRTIAERLSREANDVVLIDRDPARVKEISDHLDVHALVGNGSSPATLMEAGLEKAEMVIAVTDSDEVNLLACLMAGTASAATTKIARVRDSDYLAHHDLLERSGLTLDLIINPERVTADRIRRILAVPQSSDVVTFAEGRVLLVALRVPVGHAIAGVRLADLAKLKPSSHLLLVAINRGGQVIIPKGGDRVQGEDIVYAMVKADNLKDLAEYFEFESRPARRVFIHGGGHLGLLLARELVADGVHVKIIEPDVERCEALSHELHKVVILHGEGTDRELLEEENVAGCDAYIAITEDQEENILSALLAKRLGAKSVHALMERPGYSPLAGTIGIDVPISPRMTAVGSILQFVRRGNVRSVVALHEDTAEAIEVEAMATSSIVGRPLAEVKFPSGAIVGAVVRGEEVFIPKGTDVIEPGDRVIIFTLTRAIKQVEKAVSVSLEFF